MGVREDILKIFESGRGEYFSGELLAERLGVSRAAVWKAVKQLQEEGYHFDAVSGKGYSLRLESDVISAEGIRKILGESADRFRISTFKTVTSTNTLLKEMAAEGAAEGTVVIAAEQTAGKGRMSRRFVSPAGTGLYISLLLRPALNARESLFITTAAAVAVARTVEEVSGRRAGIKWVNDVYMDGKKICGILTEASFDMESGGLEYAVCGIGVNIFPPQGGFPEEIRHIAGAIFTEPSQGDVKNRIAAGILRKFMAYYDAFPAHAFFEEYVERSIVTGQRITVLGRGEPREALALAIDGNCNLLVRYDDGREEALHSGEVSIRSNAMTSGFPPEKINK